MTQDSVDISSKLLLNHVQLTLYFIADAVKSTFVSIGAVERCSDFTNNSHTNTRWSAFDQTVDRLQTSFQLDCHQGIAFQINAELMAEL